MITGGTQTNSPKYIALLLGTVGPQTKSSTSRWLCPQHGAPGEEATSSRAPAECLLGPGDVGPCRIQSQVIRHTHSKKPLGQQHECPGLHPGTP